MKVILELEANKLEMELPLASLLIIKQYIDLLYNGEQWKEIEEVEDNQGGIVDA